MSNTTNTAAASGAEDLQDVVSKALRRAWQLGQTYWQQADSDSYRQNKQSGETQAVFVKLVDETRAALATPTQAGWCDGCSPDNCGGCATPTATAGMEPVARIEGIDEYGPRIEWTQHWVDIGVGAKLYTESQVQAMLAAIQSLTKEQK